MKCAICKFDGATIEHVEERHKEAIDKHPTEHWFIDGRCDFCDAQSVDLHPIYGATRAKPRELVCNLCYATPVGNASLYPDQYRGQESILKTICFVGNAILKELRGRRPS